MRIGRRRSRLDHQRFDLVPIGNFDGNVHRHGPRLGVKEQWEPNYSDQHQNRSADEPVARPTAQDLHAFRLRGTSGGVVASLAELE